MSLRKRLLLILGGTFVLLWGVAALWMLGELRHEVERILDERLASSANMVAGLLEQIPAPVGAPQLSPLTSQIFGLKRGLVCQVRNLRGEVLVRSPNMFFSEPDEELLGFAVTAIDGQQWRTFTVQRRNLLITTGDKMEEREHLQRVILVAAASPVFLALVGSLVLIWLGIGRGLAPLQVLRLQLAQRKADDLTALDSALAPKELQPLVGTLNQLLARLSDLLQRERRFNDDAAHELRTPLTAIKTHLQVAQRAEPEHAIASVAKAQLAVERMQATIEQLLLLSRLSSSEDFSAIEPGSVQNVARTVLDNLFASEGFERIQVDSQLEQDVLLAVPESLAAVALRNLLENALVHSPANSPVELTICLQLDAVVFKVTDQGEGISAELFEQAQQRFWRAKSANRGSGLGLAIVAAIAQRFAGTLTANKTQTNFSVALSFPILFS